MFDRVYARKTRVVHFDEKILATDESNPGLCAKTVANIKDDNFGSSFLIMPEALNFKHSIICIAKDSTRMARRI